ncbi:hypothetical protein HN51_047521 [Arachis hypogaea]|uniref:COP1-interacting protein 7 n=2 Tax=Arachis TaxID=3817 RepID=A0A445AH12_ARAHY|nr:uncharacterized protein LOC107625298 isoform X1 [Arachis ipaensis]XP_025635947.1 COP1-interacting protein 7 isoform X1 [Arachis hypogaea]QHO23865.1 uncharacterized protein DS421_12g367250 [Arachis hypogaea]RYR25692.1 hypothetical protein Ahy_B02g059653 [Arachis hypogaea]
MTMNSSTKLDSAVFQLTPTRTRFDLVIITNGKKEKVASGLLNPFLSHLKVAQDQISKGGYSIVLVPDCGSDAAWFTKGTVERFVRFVNTPEILERVYNLESEVLQIEEAIAIQGNNCIGISTLEEEQMKKVESAEGNDINAEKSIIIYESVTEGTEANGRTKAESKGQILKVLVTRKSMLQKEQGMAFARAFAAGFDIDCLPALMSFAECFEASRLMDACRRFKGLWKRKHESGQWLEIEAGEVTPNRTDFFATNASSIILSNTATKSHTELESGSNGKTNSVNFSADQRATEGLQDNVHVQFPHNGFPPWPVHSLPGSLQAFQPYPVQGIPYYQTYPANNSFMQPEAKRLNADQNMGHRKHSMDNGNYNNESDALNAEFSMFQDEMNMERESSRTGDQRKKASRSSRQKSGMVIIRNINYVTNAERASASASEADEETEESAKATKGRGISNEESLKKLSSYDREDAADCGDKEAGGHWQAFQNLLLRDVDEDRHAVDQGMFEKVDHIRRKKQIGVNDPLDFGDRDMCEIQGGNGVDMHTISRGSMRMATSTDGDLLLSRRASQTGSGRSVVDVNSQETSGRKNGYRRAANEDFIVNKQESVSGNAKSFSDMISVNGHSFSNNKLERRLFHDDSDDSYIVNSRSVGVSGERNAMDMDSEFPKVHKKKKNLSCEPDELSLMPERGTEKGLMGYGPLLEYEMRAQPKGRASQDKNKVALAQTKPGSKMLNKEKKSSVGPIRRGKTNKPSPLDDARARAERLRSYKADLQKTKKEREEEDRKRIEALKMERQKRIAARSSTVTAKSPVPSKVTTTKLPTKLSPSSKFSDSEPRSSSPFQRFRIASIGCNISPEVSKTSKLNGGSYSATNKLSRSAPSLPDSKKEKGIDGRIHTKSTVVQSRRLSEPKMSTIHQTSLAPIRRLSEPKISTIPQSSSAQIRRLSEPKMGTIRQNSLQRSRRLSEPKMSTIRPSPSVETHNSGTRTTAKTKAVNVTESRKISAIVNHDKSKTAALPELKIRTSNASDSVQNRSSSTEKTQKLNGIKSSMNTAGTMMRKNEIHNSPNDDGDDNPIIEKTVVMLEYEKPRAPDFSNKKSENKPVPSRRQYDNDRVMDKAETVSSYALVTPILPLSTDIVDIESSENGSLLQPTEDKRDNTESKPSKSSSICIAEEPYHAPSARVSCSEDSCPRDSEQGKALPTRLETASTSIGMETFRARVSDSRNSMLEKIPEVIEKPVKESPKGLRGLLKFRRKNHSLPSGRNMEADTGSVDSSEANNARTNSSPNQVTLMSRDEAPSTSVTPQKSSRSFSLLSAFRSKSGEKKIMMA